MPNITMQTHAGFTIVPDYNWKPQSAVNPLNSTDYAAMESIVVLDAALVVANGGYWTATRLAQESLWDKLYWLRVARKVTTSAPYPGALI